MLVRHAVLALAALALAAPLARAAAPDSAAAPPPHVRRWQTGALRPDRLRHASLALTLGAGAGAVARRPGVALGVGFGLGFLKEVRDARAGGRFDAGDLAADAAGAVLAALLTRSLD